MFIFGRLLGAILGYAAFKFWGALAGYFLGGVFDRAVQRHSQQRYGDVAQVKVLFLQLMFTSLGRLAKADGVISKDEVAHTEQLIRQFGLTGQAREQAITWFQQGAKQEVRVEDLLAQSQAMLRTRPELTHLLLEMLISLVMLDAEVHAQEEAILRTIAQGLGVDARAFEQLLQSLKGRAGFAHSAPNSAAHLAAAYAVLGVSASDDDKTIKTAYRKLMSQHHPDKLMAQGVPDDVLRVATEKSQEITQAYEAIMRQRAGN